MRAALVRADTQVVDPWAYDIVEIRQLGAFWYYLALPSATRPPGIQFQAYNDTWRDLVTQHPTIANSLMKSTYMINATGIVVTTWRSDRPASGVTIIEDRLPAVQFAGDAAE